jgi:hypothetical protein
MESLIAGNDNSRDCGEQGVLFMMNLIRKMGFDTSARLYVYPMPGRFVELLISVNIF